MYDLCVRFWWKLNPFIPLTSTQVSEHVFFFYIKKEFTLDGNATLGATLTSHLRQGTDIQEV